MNRPRFHSFLGLALIFSLLSFTPAPSWADCKNSGGGGSSFNYGSEVSGSAVTICGKSVAVVPARTSVISKSAPKPLSKVVIKAPAKQVSKPPIKVVQPLSLVRIRALMKISDVPAPKTVPVAKPKPLPKPTPALKPKVIVKGPAKAVSVLSNTPASTHAAAGSANFSPDESSAAVTPSNNLSSGEQATFHSDPKVHFRLGEVLGRAAEVKFSPIQTTWQFGDGFSGSGAQASHAFASGNFDIEVTITYAVSYRFSGQSAWISDPGQIEMPASVRVFVGDSPSWDLPAVEAPPTRKFAFLVSANCLEAIRPVGCLD